MTATLYGTAMPPKYPWDRTYPWQDPRGLQIVLYGVGVDPGVTAYAVTPPSRDDWWPPWVPSPFDIPPVPGPVTMPPVTVKPVEENPPDMIATLEQRLAWVRQQIETLRTWEQMLCAGLKAMRKAATRTAKK
jgi:hypothetical protein